MSSLNKKYSRNFQTVKQYYNRNELLVCCVLQGLLGKNSLILCGKVGGNKVKIELSLQILTSSCLCVFSFEEKCQNLTFSPEMLGKGGLGDLVAGQKGCYSIFFQEFKDENPYQLLNFENFHRISFDLVHSPLKEKISFRINHLLHKLPIDVFFVPFFDFLQDGIEGLDFLLVIVEKFQDGVFGSMCAEEGKCLIDDVGFCVFFLVDHAV